MLKERNVHVERSIAKDGFGIANYPKSIRFSLLNIIGVFKEDWMSTIEYS